MTIYTHRRNTPAMTTGYVVMFLRHDDDDDCPRNYHYGDYVWTLTREDVDALPEIPESVIELAMEDYGLTREEALDNLQPPAIVDHGGLWESEQFVSDVWQLTEARGFRTPDGCVILDSMTLPREGRLDDEF